MTAEERYDLIEDEISRVSEAIDCLTNVRECEDVVLQLNDRLILLNIEREECSQAAIAADRAEQCAMTREYWRSVT